MGQREKHGVGTVAPLCYNITIWLWETDEVLEVQLGAGSASASWLPPDWIDAVLLGPLEKLALFSRQACQPRPSMVNRQTGQKLLPSPFC